jgi:hypothetical protein
LNLSIAFSCVSDGTTPMPFRVDLPGVGGDNRISPDCHAA